MHQCLLHIAFLDQVLSDAFGCRRTTTFLGIGSPQGLKWLRFRLSRGHSSEGQVVDALRAGRVTWGAQDYLEVELTLCWKRQCRSGSRSGIATITVHVHSPATVRGALFHNSSASSGSWAEICVQGGPPSIQHALQELGTPPLGAQESQWQQPMAS